MWARIARANGLRDPFLPGDEITLVIPPKPPDGREQSGVIGA